MDEYTDTMRAQEVVTGIWSKSDGDTSPILPDVPLDSIPQICIICKQECEPFTCKCYTKKPKAVHGDTKVATANVADNVKTEQKAKTSRRPRIQSFGTRRSAATIAAGYGVTRSSGSYEGSVAYRTPCPAHGGKDKNLSIWDGNDGSLGAKCHSHDCDYATIMRALGVESKQYPRRRRRTPRIHNTQRHPQTTKETALGAKLDNIQIKKRQ